MISRFRSLKICSIEKKQTLGESVDKDQLFVLKPNQMMITLPHSFESGETITTDGRWVKIKSNNIQFFFRTRKLFKISVGSCYVGRRLPFVYRYRKGMVVSVYITLGLICFSGFINFAVWSSPVSLHERASENAHTKITPKAFPPKSSFIHITNEIKSTSTPVITERGLGTKSTNQLGGGIQELDPMRCVPISNGIQQKQNSHADKKGHIAVRTWYVCR